MMTIQRRALRVRGTLAIFAGLTLAACGGSESLGPDGPDNGVLAPGGGVAVNGTTPLSLDGGSTGTENVLVIVDTGLTTGSAKFSYTVTATGTGDAGAVAGPATALVPLAEATEAAAPSASAPVLDIGYGMRLNARSRARFAGRFQAARSAVLTGSALPRGMSRSIATAAPVVGDLLRVNVSQDLCTPLVNRGARVVAVGTQSIILSDTLNPTGGFTTADFERFAAKFDTLVYPLDIANFGIPSDIDGNKKVVILFTTAVNALTPANSTSYVGGFFFDRDLFPVAECAGSNFSEMFYMLAPDPNGTINGNKRATAFVDSVTTSVLAHEFQHLINSSRRLYVSQAPAFEDTWLNEGLSHIAEELLFYREANLTPRQNIDSIKIRSANTIRIAFNYDMASNAGRFKSFLVAPSENSPFRNDDSLETRGATWDLLRYLADRKGGSDVATWQALVNTTKVGLANLATVFGNDLGVKVHDWNVSHYTDDFVAGVPPEQLQPSWNWRSVFKATAGAGKAYPLEVKTLTGGTASGTLINGAAAYYRFSVPAGTVATVTISTTGPLYSRVVRVR